MAMGNEGVHDSQIRVDDLDVMYMVRKFWNSYNIAPSIQYFFVTKFLKSSDLGETRIWIYQIPKIKSSICSWIIENLNLPYS